MPRHVALPWLPLPSEDARAKGREVSSSTATSSIVEKPYHTKGEPLGYILISTYSYRLISLYLHIVILPYYHITMLLYYNRYILLYLPLFLPMRFSGCSLFGRSHPVEPFSFTGARGIYDGLLKQNRILLLTFLYQIW